MGYVLFEGEVDFGVWGVSVLVFWLFGYVFGFIMLMVLVMCVCGKE